MPFFKQLCSNLQNFNWDITLHGLPATAELFCLPEYHYHIFHKAKLHIIYVNLLLTSVFKDPFHHLPSMFQQLNPTERSAPHWVAFPFPFWGRQMDAWLFYYANCILWRLHNKKNSHNTICQLPILVRICRTKTPGLRWTEWGRHGLTVLDGALMKSGADQVLCCPQAAVCDQLLLDKLYMTQHRQHCRDTQ